MKKNIVKIVLDVIMLLLLFLMYQKQVISLNFHEIGGLAVCGLFLIHKALNWKWISGITGKLFSKNLAGRARLGYAVDCLMLLSFLFIPISGVFISKTILTSISSPARIWKTGHYFASALAVILCGIHLGLHWNYIKTIFAKVIRLPGTAARPLFIVLLVVVLAYGCYSAATSSFLGWLAAPFQVSAAGELGNGMGQGGGEGLGKGAGGEGLGKKADADHKNEFSPSDLPQDKPADSGGMTGSVISPSDLPQDKPADSGMGGSIISPSDLPQDKPADSGGMTGSIIGGAPGSGLIVISPGDLTDDVQDQLANGNGQELHQGEEETGPVSLIQVLGVLATYGSIAAVFAAITAMTDALIVHKKRAKQ